MSQTNAAPRTPNGLEGQYKQGQFRRSPSHWEGSRPKFCGWQGAQHQCPNNHIIFRFKEANLEVGPDHSFAISQCATAYQAPGAQSCFRAWSSLFLQPKQASKNLNCPGRFSPWFAKRSLASFNLQRKLRSSAFSIQHIYAVHKCKAPKSRHPCFHTKDSEKQPNSGRAHK